jgi:hypothetical protein
MTTNDSGGDMASGSASWTERSGEFSKAVRVKQREICNTFENKVEDPPVPDPVGSEAAQWKHSRRSMHLVSLYSSDVWGAD